mmetsp:Transcript_4834/g.5512  ORF Transcript_4834/g.5512 Transcript_4834/m.5512 type:complete len:105 (-) Transcript_4834:307-621(-)
MSLWFGETSLITTLCLECVFVYTYLRTIIKRQRRKSKRRRKQSEKRRSRAVHKYTLCTLNELCFPKALSFFNVEPVHFTLKTFTVVVALLTLRLTGKSAHLSGR